MKVRVRSYFLGGLREEAEGVVTETMSFRHEDPFNADEQDTSPTVSILNLFICPDLSCYSFII